MGLVEDAQAHLNTQGICGDSVVGWPSVRRLMHDDSNQLVVLTEAGGPTPELGAPSGVGEFSLKDPAVQIRVRGEAEDSDSAYAKMMQIFDALHGKLHTTIGATMYLRVRAQSSEPLFLGFDGRNRPEFVTTFMAKTQLV